MVMNAGQNASEIGKNKITVDKQKLKKDFHKNLPSLQEPFFLPALLRCSVFSRILPDLWHTNLVFLLPFFNMKDVRGFTNFDRVSSSIDCFHDSNAEKYRILLQKFSRLVFE